MRLARLTTWPALALTTLLLAGCGTAGDETADDSAAVAPDGGDAAARVAVDDEPFIVESVQSKVDVVCPAVTSPRTETVEVRNLRNALIRFTAAGRDHRLWVWRLTGGNRTIKMTELSGEDIGVAITVTGAPLPANKAWGILTLDSSDCAAGYAEGAAVLKLEDNGDITVPEGRIDPKSKHGFAAMHGNSAYIIATPGPLTGNQESADQQ